MNLEFSWQSFEKYSSDFIKLRPVGDRQTDSQTDRGTDMTKLIVAFRNFAKAHNRGMIMRSPFYLYVPNCVDAISTFERTHLVPWHLISYLCYWILLQRHAVQFLTIRIDSSLSMNLRIDREAYWWINKIMYSNGCWKSTELSCRKFS